MSGAPEAEAVALDEEAEWPRAWKLIVVLAVRSRLVTASTLWFEIVSASATPTAAVPPVESPDAVVVAEAFSVAVASTLPADGGRCARADVGGARDVGDRDGDGRCK